MPDGGIALSGAVLDGDFAVVKWLITHLPTSESDDSRLFSVPSVNPPSVPCSRWS
jgi:hypothetical protein